MDTCKRAPSPLRWGWISVSELNAFRNSIGQCLSLAASFLFPSPQGPQFVQGCIVNIAFQAFGLLIALGMTLYFRWENSRRDKREGKPVAGEHLSTYEQFDLAPGQYTPSSHFRLTRQKISADMYRFPLHIVIEIAKESEFMQTISKEEGRSSLKPPL